MKFMYRAKWRFYVDVESYNKNIVLPSSFYVRISMTFFLSKVMQDVVLSEKVCRYTALEINKKCYHIPRHFNYGEDERIL